MDQLLNKSLKVRIYHFLTKRVVYHSLFWLALLILLMMIEGIQQGFLFTLGNEVINVLFFCIIVYFNLYYLIPNYLTKKKFLTYCVLLILSTIILTPLKVIVFYFRFEGLPNAQADLIRDQNWYFLITFFIAGSSTIFKIVNDLARQLR